jgi:hypothetical protein
MSGGKKLYSRANSNSENFNLLQDIHSFGFK